MPPVSRRHRCGERSQRLLVVLRGHSGLLARYLLTVYALELRLATCEDRCPAFPAINSNGTMHAMRYLFTANIRLIPLALLAFAGSAVAGDYTYAMASNDSVYAASGAGVNESAGSSASSSAGSIDGMDSRYLVSDDDASSADPVRSESSDSVTVPTVSGGGSAGSDRRSTHRWQSLVPGAIK